MKRCRNWWRLLFQGGGEREAPRHARRDLPGAGRLHQDAGRLHPNPEVRVGSRGGSPGLAAPCGRTDALLLFSGREATTSWSRSTTETGGTASRSRWPSAPWWRSSATTGTSLWPSTTPSWTSGSCTRCPASSRWGHRGARWVTRKFPLLCLG